jgi:hypothetical protein
MSQSPDIVNVNGIEKPFDFFDRLNQRITLPLDLDSAHDLSPKILKILDPSSIRHPVRKALDVLWETLNEHQDDIDQLFDIRLMLYLPAILELQEKHYVILFYWANECHKSSMLLAMQGYYNPAYSQIRTLLELSLLLVYFSDHEAELQSWMNNDVRQVPQVSQLLRDYLPRVESLAHFRTENFNSKETGSFNELFDDLGREYKKLCSSVHGKYTHANDLSIMNYQKAAMLNYLENCRTVLQLTHTLVVANFNAGQTVKDYCTSHKDILNLEDLFPSKYLKHLNIGDN